MNDRMIKHVEILRKAFESAIVMDSYLVDDIIKDLMVKFKVDGATQLAHHLGGDVFKPNILKRNDENGEYISPRVQSHWNTACLIHLGTPASIWFVSSGEDPFKEYGHRERSELAMGKLTDDQLANEVYLYGDSSSAPMTIERMMSGRSPIALLTGAKERIRWLSRKLISAQDEIIILKQQLKEASTSTDDMK